ncbi:MAG: hypothetical protein AB3A66_28635 (plasmid) [Nodularia sp. CChRGM 3473]
MLTNRLTPLGYRTLVGILIRAAILAALASVPSLLILLSASASLPWCEDGEQPGHPPKCRPIVVLPELDERGSGR